MTTSPQTDWMNHPAIRQLVDGANALSVPERLTLLKGLVPKIAEHLPEEEYLDFIDELRLKGQRYYEAASSSEGRASRTVPGEREIEGR